MPDQEQERLKRLRERQLADRDPLIKQRQFQHTSAQKEQRAKKPFSLAKAWKDVPHIVKSPFYGLVLGAIVIYVLPKFWASSYAILIGIAATIIFIIFGIVVGQALDTRDKLKELIR